jgi:hypothetical protein
MSIRASFVLGVGIMFLSGCGSPQRKPLDMSLARAGVSQAIRYETKDHRGVAVFQDGYEARVERKERRGNHVEIWISMVDPAKRAWKVHCTISMSVQSGLVNVGKPNTKRVDCTAHTGDGHISEGSRNMSLDITSPLSDGESTMDWRGRVTVSITYPSEVSQPRAKTRFRLAERGTEEVHTLYKDENARPNSTIGLFQLPPRMGAWYANEVKDEETLSCLFFVEASLFLTHGIYFD